MFSIDIFNNKDPLSLYLSTPDKKIITCINEGIDDTSSNLSVSLNQQYELTFTYKSKIIDKETGMIIDSPGYDYIVEGMYLALEHVGLFKMESPVIYNDGGIEYKEVTAKSCDNELEHKIFSAKINTGESDSQEFLVTYDLGETEILLNEYTGIPFDWIVLYNTFPEQLQILLTDYNNGVYGTPNTDITLTDLNKIKSLCEYLKLIPRLVTKITKDSNGNLSRSDYVIYTYDEENEDEITLMTISKSFGARIKELITFYKKYRDKLSLLTLALEKMDGNWTVGEIYGMADGDYSLCNKKGSFDANETIYSFLTQTLAQAIECVVYFNITNRTVNVIPADKIGNDTGVIMSYETLVNSVNISCDESNLTTRLYVKGADNLGIEQVNYGDSELHDLTYKISARDSNGNRIYVSDDLAEKYQVYQHLREDNRDTWVNYTKEYNLYLNDIDEIRNRVPNDDLKNEWGTYSKDFLQKTLQTYNNLLAALQTMYKEDYGSNGLNSDGSINDNYIKNTEYWYDYKAYQNIIVQLECAIDVWPSYSDDTKWTKDQRSKYLDTIKAYETEWTLYGTDELNAKIATYNNNMKALLDKESVCRVSEGSENIKSWTQLSDAEKNKYGSVEKTYTDSYEIYIENKTNRDSAQEYLDSLNEQIKSLESKRDAVQEKRNALKKTVSYDNYFTSDERKTLSLLYRDAEYTNDNILTTSIDDAVTTVDHQFELLRDAQEKLEIYSRPQLNFETEVNNLLGLTEFAPFWNDFKLGNYIYIEFRDNKYMKTRLVNYQINPFNPDVNELTIGFSSFIISKSKRWDITSLLNMSITDGLSSYSSSSSGKGSGAIDSELSETMLSKLLNSESFGLKVSNVILDTMKVNLVTAQKGVFNSLYADDFNFAGGRIVYKNGVLYLDGKLSFGNVEGGKEYVDSVVSELKLLEEALGCEKTTITKDWVFSPHITGGDITIGDKNGIYAQISSSGKLRCNGAEINGSIYATSLTLGDGVTISTNNINGLSAVAKSGSYKDLIDANKIIDTDDINISTSTTSDGLSKKTITVGTQSFDIIDGGDFVLLEKPYGNDTADASKSYTKINKDGLLTAKNALIYGTVYATNGEFRGAITATSLSLESGVTISANKINGLSSVATSGKFNDLTGIDNIIQVDDINISATTTSNGLSKKTITIGTSSFELIEGGDFVLLENVYGKESTTTSSTASSGYIKISKNGLLKAENAIIYGDIYANNGYFKGEIKAGSTITGSSITCGDNFSVTSDGVVTANNINISGNSSIAGWNITSGKIFAGDGVNDLVAVVQRPSSKMSYVFAAGGISHDSYADCPFRVTKYGKLYAKNAVFENSIYMYDIYNDKNILVFYAAGAGSVDVKTTMSFMDNVYFDGFVDGNIIPAEVGKWYIGTRGNEINYVCTKHVAIGLSDYSESTGTITSRWKDGEPHNVITRDADGLTCALGWAGDSTYQTVLKLRGQTVQYTNSSGTTTLSDERLKKDFTCLDEWENFYMSLEPTAFRYTDGASGRYHIGYKAQQVQSALESSGLTTQDFAGFVQYKVDKNDEESWHGYETEYGLIYTEFTALNTHMIQKALKEIESLKQENLELKSRISQLENI